jgi:hypothetical protein
LSVRRSWLWVALGGLVWTAVPGTVRAQEGLVQEGPPELEFTGPLLDPEHWAVEAVGRLKSVGLADQHLGSQKALPLEEVERVLRAASRNEGAAGLSRLAAAWHARLLEEFGGIPIAVADSGRVPVVLTGRTSVGIRWREGAAAPGLGEFEPDRTGALPLEERTRWVGIAETSISWGRHLALGGRVESDQDGIRFDRLQLAAGWRGIRASIGRAPVGYGHGHGGGVLLSGDVPLDAVQMGTREPFLLPWILSHIGPVSVHGFMGRMWEDRHPGDPYLWGGTAHLRPHPRLTLGIHRAALFGGKPEEPVTVGKVLGMLVGRVSSLGFEDQIVSASGRFDLPTESLLPLTAYLEWGAEDAAGAWHDVPGLVGGIFAPSLPFASGLAVGAEYAHFSTSCCGNPKWYRHWSFVGSWASREATLGHPLGGDGRQAMLFGEAHLFEARARVAGSVYRRERRGENLYVPGRAGTSTGASASVEVRPLRSWEVRLEAAGESGSDWSDRNLKIEVSHF